MNAIKEVISYLITGGMDTAEAAALVAMAVAEGNLQKRSSGAERTARWREKKASQTVTERHNVTPTDDRHKPSLSVTERHNVTQLSLSVDSSTVVKGKEEKKEREPRRKPRHGLPADFKLTDAMRQLALDRGVSTARIPQDFDRFCDYHRSKATLSADWMASWRTWADRSVQYAQQAETAQRQASTYVDGRL
jgi:hypothetical protein